MQPGELSAPLGYHGMRLRWCRDSLLRLIRRWAVYIVVGALVAGAGASGAWQAVTALAAWLVLPLFFSAGHGAWLAVATAAHGLAVGGVAVALAPLLWRRSWADSERGLPIAPGRRLASDATVVALALVPLLFLCTVGALTLLGHRPAWLLPYAGRAVASLLLALVAAIALGTAFVQWQRRVGGRGRKDGIGAASRPSGSSLGLHAGIRRWPRVLVWWPLWRGPARRTGLGLWAASAALCAPAAGLAFSAGFTGWWLAGFALLALALTSVLDAVARRELGGLHEACAPLPLRLPRLARARAALALVPLLPGLAGLLLSLAAAKLPLRPLVLAAYVAGCVGGCVAEVLAGPRDAQSKASRWLLTLVVAVALASEVAA